MFKYTAFTTMNIHEVQLLEVKCSANSTKSTSKLHWVIRLVIFYFSGSWKNPKPVQCHLCRKPQHTVLISRMCSKLWLVLDQDLLKEEITKCWKGIEKSKNCIICSDNSQIEPTGNIIPRDCSRKLFASFQVFTSISSWAPPLLRQRSDLQGFSYQHY